MDLNDVNKPTGLRAIRDKIAKSNEEKYKQSSKDRLNKIAKTKITTTFIGAIEQFEQKFGFIWGHGKHESDLTEEELVMREYWNECRKAIMDKGHEQIRGLAHEIENHTMSWNKNSVVMPVKPFNKEEGR